MLISTTNRSTPRLLLALAVLAHSCSASPPLTSLLEPNATVTSSLVVEDDTQHDWRTQHRPEYIEDETQPRDPLDGSILVVDASRRRRWEWGGGLETPEQNHGP